MINRNTKQRKEVYEAVKGVNKHLTAEQVMSILEKKNIKIGLATVYRNLNYLSKNKMIRKFEQEGVVLYDGNPEAHDHLHCVMCNQYFDIPSTMTNENLKSIRQNWNFEVVDHVCIYEGICQNCRTKNSH